MAEGEPSLVETAKSLPALPLDGHWLRVDWHPLELPDLASELVAAHRTSPSSELVARAATARSLITRTGFVPTCQWHFVAQRDGRWFVWADMAGQVEAGGIDPPADVAIMVGDPPAFRDLPTDLREALGGDHGPIAWALQVLLEVSAAGRSDAQINNELTGYGHTIRHLDEGDGGAAVKHLAALFAQHRADGFAAGVALGHAEERARAAVDRSLKGGRQQNTPRSLQRTTRIEALITFLDRLPANTSNLAIARLAIDAQDDADPLFADVVLGKDTWMEREHPRELAKDVATAVALRKQRAQQTARNSELQRLREWLAGDMQGPAPMGDLRSDDDT